MRKLLFVFTLVFALPGQPLASAGRGISPQAVLRSDPPSAALEQRFIAFVQPRGAPYRPVLFSHILLDKANRVYFGYEMMVEPQTPGAYLVTFGKLGISPLDLAFDLVRKVGAFDKTWTPQALPAIPAPLTTHDGFIFPILLYVDPATGAKLIDDIHIEPARTISHVVPLPNRNIPTVSGPAHDFRAADGELQLVQPRVTVGGNSLGMVTRNTRGSLVWIYVPGRGRYVLSLVPRPDLGFQKIGEVRGGAVTFGSVKLECVIAVAAGDAAYNLYVLQDADWQPSEDRQKSQPSIGTVSEAELAALKR